MKLRKRNYRAAAEVSTASLNDIMFFLLLFFLIISTLVNPSVIKLMLPKASSSQTLSKQQFTIDISKEKLIFLNNKPIEFDQLEPQLSTLIRGVSDPTIVLRIDQSLTIQDLVDILEVGNRLKVKTVLATRSSNK